MPCSVNRFLLLPSADCVLLWTAISSRLFSSALLLSTLSLSLSLSIYLSIYLLWDLPSPSTSGLAGDLALRLFVRVSRQNRQRDSLSGTNTNRNECQPSRHNREQVNSKFLGTITVINNSSFHLKVLETIYISSCLLSLCKQRELLLGLNIISIVFNI